MILTKNGEYLTLSYKGKELVYSLKLHKFINSTKGFNRIKIDDITYSEGTEVYREILNTVRSRKSYTYVPAIKKLSENTWVEILIKSDIRLYGLSEYFKSKSKWVTVPIQNKQGRSPRSILGISQYMIEILKEHPDELSNYLVEEARNVELKYDITILKGFEFKDVYHKITEDVSCVRLFRIITGRAKTDARNFFKMTNNLLSWGYPMRELEDYVNDYESKELSAPEEVLLLLYSYVDWCKFLDKKYEPFPKDLLVLANRAYIESSRFDEGFAKHYSKIYTNKYDTENISMPTSYEEFVREAKAMKNCLLKESQGYLWRITNGNTLVLFSNYNNYKTAIEIEIVTESSFLLRQMLGVCNEVVPTYTFLREELKNHFKTLGINLKI